MSFPSAILDAAPPQARRGNLLFKNTNVRNALNVATPIMPILLHCNVTSKGYDALVVVRPLLLQVLDEAGDFPMELHHHPARTHKGMFLRW